MNGIKARAISVIRFIFGMVEQREVTFSDVLYLKSTTFAEHEDDFLILQGFDNDHELTTTTMWGTYPLEELINNDEDWETIIFAMFDEFDLPQMERNTILGIWNI